MGRKGMTKTVLILGLIAKPLSCLALVYFFLGFS